MTPGPSPFVHSFSHLLALLAFSGCFLRCTRCEPDPPSNFPLSSAVRDVSEGFRVVVPTRFQKRITRHWAGADALPKRFERFPWNTEGGCDWRDALTNAVARTAWVI